MPPKNQQKDTNSDAKLTKEQEEEMNSALIAKLLAQDALEVNGNYYYAEYSNNPRQYDSYKGNNSGQDDSYEDESDDYSPKRYVKGKKTKSKKAEQAERRGRKRKNAPMDIDANANTNITIMKSTEPSTLSSQPDSSKTIKLEKTKKVKKPLPPGFKTGTYADEEEVLFLQGLDMYGRSWNELSQHMGTRDPHSIRSHAQKHFIKLYRDNLPLPDKVKESGEGYTLSGKPLDPDSAAARPYLNRLGMGTKATAMPADVANGDLMQVDVSNICDANAETSNGTEQAAADLDIGSMSLAPSKQQISCSAESQIESTISAANKTGLSTSIKNQTGSPSSTANQTGPSSSTTDQTGPSSSTANGTESSSSTAKSQPINRRSQEETPVTTYEDNGRTNYATSRLRRPESRNYVNSYKTQTSSGDQLIMVKCNDFNGEIGSDAFNAQPFLVTVHSNALLTMDFHAHLMTSEIIGFLAGEWDRTSRQLIVKAAFPCRSLDTPCSETNVEMDPTSALEVRQLIIDKNMMVVGWYHSHPVFLPDPSLVDIDNQLNYQILCRDDGNTTYETLSASVTPVNIVQDSVTPDSAPSSSSSPSSSSTSTTTTTTTAVAASSSSSAPLVQANDNTHSTDIPELSHSEQSSASTSSAASPSSSIVMQPFVGAIVGPYDPQLPSAPSVFNFFYVVDNRTEKKIPKRLVYDIVDDLELTLDDENRLLQLPIVYRDSPSRVNFGDNWRRDSQETKLEKLIKSLGARMPWVQRRLREQQQQQGNVLAQGKADGPAATHEMGMFTDSFLERVQTALVYW